MNKKGMWGIFATVITIIIIVSCSLTWHFWLGPKIALKNVEASHDIIDKTITAENAIYNYEWFKTQYEKIGASEKQIKNTKTQIDEFKNLYGDATGWDYITKEEYSRLSSTLLGQNNYYETLVSDYNARSKMANREIFKDSLPFNVDKKIW